MMKDNIREYLNNEENYSIFMSIDDKIIDPLRFFQLLEQAEKICLNIDLPHIVKKKYYSFLSQELPGINENNENDFKIGHLIATHLTHRLDNNVCEDWMFKEIKGIPFGVIQEIVNKNVIISIPPTASLQKYNPETSKEKQYSSSNSQLDLKGKIEIIVELILESCIEIIDKPKLFGVSKDHFKDKANKQRENHRTNHIINKFNDKTPEFFIDNQHLTGQSETRNSTGTVDFAIFFDKKKIVIGEALNFSGQNTNSVNQNIINHLKKITKNYNLSTLNNLIFLVYYEGNYSKFYDSYNNYLKQLYNCTQLGFECKKKIPDKTSTYKVNSASVRIAKSIHSYSNNSENRFSIYHFYLDFSEK